MQYWKILLVFGSISLVFSAQAFATDCGEMEWDRAFAATDEPSKSVQCMSEKIETCSPAEIKFTNSPMGWMKYKIVVSKAKACVLEFRSEKGKKKTTCSVKKTRIQELKSALPGKALILSVTNEMERVRGLREKLDSVTCDN